MPAQRKEVHLGGVRLPGALARWPHARSAEGGPPWWRALAPRAPSSRPGCACGGSSAAHLTPHSLGRAGRGPLPPKSRPHAGNRAAVLGTAACSRGCKRQVYAPLHWALLRAWLRLQQPGRGACGARLFGLGRVRALVAEVEARRARSRGRKRQVYAPLHCLGTSHCCCERYGMKV